MRKTHFALIPTVLVFLIFFALIWAFWVLAAGLSRQSGGDLLISIGSSGLKLEIADSDEERIRGLSSRDFMASDRGMLFVFNHSDYHGIWMRRMRFPIDILWLDDTGKVIDLRETVLPETFPEVFKPKLPARFVLEINAGQARARGVLIGTVVGVEVLKRKERASF